jgi:hypothetical protein
MNIPLLLAALRLMPGPVSAHATELGDILTRNAMAHIREPAFEVRGTDVATRDGEMRIDVEADGQRVFSEGLDKCIDGLLLYRRSDNVNLDSGEWLGTT